jgi:hypothetical protein
MSFEPLAIGDLRIDTREDGAPNPTLCLTWQGKSNVRQADKVIAPYLEAALTRAADRGAGLELHFEQLSHFNSSTIASLIQLIQMARARGVRLVVFSDPRRQWQRLSFDALRVFVQPDGLFELREAAAEDATS